MKTKNLIIGAGISGLTLATYLDDYLIVEKENEVGGYCRTIRRNGYVWDYAGHFFHFKTDDFKEMFIKTVKTDVVNKNKCTKIIYKDKLIDYPFQMNIHELSKDEFIDCLYDLFMKCEKDSYDNFLDMLYGKFGKSIVEKFLKPYNEKLYAIDLTKLDVDAMGRFFPYADIKSIVRNMKESNNNSYNNTFMYPKNGAKVFIDVLYNKLDSSKILLNNGIKELDYVNKKAILSDDTVVYYDNLINTIPLNKFMDLIDYNSDSLSYNKVLVLNLGFDKKSNLVDEHWLYVPNKDRNYYRLGFYDNIIGQDRLSMYIEIGFKKDFIIDNEVIQKELDITLSNLKLDGIIDDSFNLIDYEPIVMDPAYVHISKESIDLVNKFESDMRKYNIYITGRYGKWTYCSMEDSMLSAKDLSTLLNN